MIKNRSSATLSPLTRADGSASSSSNGFSVVGAINGPVEVQRRDELPQEAVVDVAIRPVSGVGGIRERHLEIIIQNALRHIILVSAHPRTLIQVTLQIVDGPGSDSESPILPQAASNLPILPVLLETSMLALLTTSIPLSMMLTSTMIAADADGELVSDPSPGLLENATSVHVLAFSSLGDLLVIESEGNFNIDTWDRVHKKARRVCRGSEADGNLDKEDEEDDEDDEDEEMDVDMDTDKTTQGIPSKERMLRKAVEEQAKGAQRWKQS